jgi:hypothetical protein
MKRRPRSMPAMVRAGIGLAGCWTGPRPTRHAGSRAAFQEMGIRRYAAVAQARLEALGAALE